MKCCIGEKYKKLKEHKCEGEEMVMSDSVEGFQTSTHELKKLRGEYGVRVSTEE
jgi:hypothetical protein